MKKQSRHVKHAVREKKNSHHLLVHNSFGTYSQGFLEGIDKYKPIILVFAYCLLLAFVQAGSEHSVSGMHAFMGYFFIFLSIFKFFDLHGFVKGFSTYDIVAKKYHAYGYAYPFIELLLGIAYLTGFHLFFVNILTFFIMLIGGIGVLNSIRFGHRIECACLGTALHVPLSTVSVLENFGMGAMAVYSLILH